MTLNNIKMVKDIYKINCKCGEFYIGSTNNLKQRTSSHRNNFHNNNKPHYYYKVYKHFNIKDALILEI